MAKFPAVPLMLAAEAQLTAELASLPNRYTCLLGSSSERLPQLVGLCDRGRIGTS